VLPSRGLLWPTVADVVWRCQRQAFINHLPKATASKTPPADHNSLYSHHRQSYTNTKTQKTQAFDPRNFVALPFPPHEQDLRQLLRFTSPPAGVLQVRSFQTASLPSISLDVTVPFTLWNHDRADLPLATHHYLQTHSPPIHHPRPSHRCREYTQSVEKLLSGFRELDVSRLRLAFTAAFPTPVGDRQPLTHPSTREQPPNTTNKPSRPTRSSRVSTHNGGY
jgi:hypothetical protein